MHIYIYVYEAITIPCNSIWPTTGDVNNRADEKENNTFFTINFRSILTNIIKWRFIVSTDVVDDVVLYRDYVLYATLVNVIRCWSYKADINLSVLNT